MNKLKIEVAQNEDDYSVSDQGSFEKGGFNLSHEWKGLKYEDIQQLEPLGYGASAVVYKAVHKPTKKILAIKDINVFDQRKRDQILKELKALDNQNCPNLVEFFGAFYSDGSISIALEYMEGGTLKDVLKHIKSTQKDAKIPEPVLSRIVKQVLTGLKYLHKDRHMVHRDIKPSNILVSANGVFKISDFGTSTELENTLAKCATFVGTTNYMSAERLKGEQYSYPSDIWSMGVAIFEAAAGYFPFTRENGQPIADYWELLNRLTNTEVPKLSPAQGFSPELCDIVAQTMHKEPEKRATALDLLSHPFITKFNTPAAETQFKDWILPILNQIKSSKTQQTKQKESIVVDKLKKLQL